MLYFCKIYVMRVHCIDIHTSTYIYIHIVFAVSILCFSGVLSMLVHNSLKEKDRSSRKNKGPSCRGGRATNAVRDLQGPCCGRAPSNHTGWEAHPSQTWWHKAYKENSSWDPRRGVGKAEAAAGKTPSSGPPHPKSFP